MNEAPTVRSLQTGADVLEIFRIPMNEGGGAKRSEFCRSVEKLVPLRYRTRLPEGQGSQFFRSVDKALVYIYDISPIASRGDTLANTKRWQKVCWMIASLIPARFFPEHGMEVDRFLDGVTAYLQENFARRSQGDAINNPINQHQRFLTPPSNQEGASVSAPPGGGAKGNSNFIIKIEPPNGEGHVRPSTAPSRLTSNQDRVLTPEAETSSIPHREQRPPKKMQRVSLDHTENNAVRLHSKCSNLPRIPTTPLPCFEPEPTSESTSPSESESDSETGPEVDRTAAGSDDEYQPLPRCTDYASTTISKLQSQLEAEKKRSSEALVRMEATHEAEKADLRSNLTRVESENLFLKRLFQRGAGISAADLVLTRERLDPGSTYSWPKAFQRVYNPPTKKAGQGQGSQRSQT